MGVAERGKEKESRKKAGGGGSKKRGKGNKSPLFLRGNGKEGESITLPGGGGEREPFLLCLMSHFLGSAEDKERRRKGATACRKGG